MTARALILAVEDYPSSEVTSRALPGTLDNASKFRDWLVQEMSVSPEQIWFCASGAGAGQTHEATREGVRTAVLDLLRQGRGHTNSLFVYVTGHGLSKTTLFKEDRDVLLCSEFVHPRTSGDACILLGELTQLLSEGLGPGDHFWFVDVCRNETTAIEPTTLGIAPDRVAAGTAKWCRLFSTRPGHAAPTGPEFVDAVIEGLNGNCDLVDDPSEPGMYWVTFPAVARSVKAKLAPQGRTADARTTSIEGRIRRVQRAGAVATIVGAGRDKLPPVALLTTHEEVIFLGETNGQLPEFLERAFEERGRMRWKRLDILTIEELKEAHRGDTPLQELEDERATAETFFRTTALEMCDALSLYRYDYAGTYGSFWTAADGARRAHASARLAGQDIRSSPASDYIDFPGMTDPVVDKYFELARNTLGNARCVFVHPSEK